ncbi:MAG: site-specific DNA-methyltransferase [Neisseriales bacterium]|nr:MAG: site-specific DNA-methyltransferase [Neisseriales bacterium]
MQKLIQQNRIYATNEKSIRYIYFLDDFGFKDLVSFWDDTAGARNKTYVVQTAEKVLERCILASTDPGDLILDPTCGSGTTAVVAERFGRRWITCDTSRVAINIAKQRLATQIFDYFSLAEKGEGVSSGFLYQRTEKITMGSIIGEEPPEIVTFVDRPIKDNTKIRVTGPFTVEAVPAPIVKRIDEEDLNISERVDIYATRTPETIRQYDWQDELLKTGIRGKFGQKIEFAYIETLAACHYLHADAETKSEFPERAVIVFGPDHAPLEQCQVSLAIGEAQDLIPKPTLIIFAAFQFDPEAAKGIDEAKWPNT